jgi:two-component system, OmpR family, sensor histidine kinase KdpD
MTRWWDGFSARSALLARRPRSVAVLVIAAALAGATAAVSFIEGPPFRVLDASPIYLVAVVAVGIAFGTWPAIVTAVGAFLVYDLLFVEPRFTLTVDDPREWLDLVLFLFVGIAIGRLSALQGERAAEAARRARESQALFRISRTLATAATVAEALPAIVRELVAETDMRRIWVSRVSGGREPTVADSDPGTPVPQIPVQMVLARTAGDLPARWVRTHSGTDARPAGSPSGGTDDLFRVRIESERGVIGSLWGTRPRARRELPREETRLMSLAADQLGLAYHREQLTAEANAAEVARQSERLKSALLESVSHDLRTPLASIRAAAGSLLDSEVAMSPDESRTAARLIDLEADRLSRLVRNLLDMTRIEGGALSPDLELFELVELVEPVIKRAVAFVPAPRITLEVLTSLPPVRIDAVYFDEVMTNLVENAVRHAPGAPIRVSAWTAGEGARVVVRVEDGGEGVPPEALLHLFEKFYRVASSREGSRRGLGIGLSVVKGLVEAMGGDVRAGKSELGGLAVDVRLPAAPSPPPEATAA